MELTKNFLKFCHGGEARENKNEHGKQRGGAGDNQQLKQVLREALSRNEKYYKNESFIPMMRVADPCWDEEGQTE